MKLNKGILSDAIEQAHLETSDFDLNPSSKLPITLPKSSAVLVGFLDTELGLQIVLTKRSKQLKHHPGQVSFPGGKVDETDLNLKETALRESNEEVALPKSNVEILGILPEHTTGTGYLVTPVIGWISEPWVVKVQASEVSECFFAPAENVLDPLNFRIESREWGGQNRHYYVVPFGPYYIWGATARILKGLSTVLGGK